MTRFNVSRRTLVLAVLLLVVAGCDQDEENPVTPGTGDNIPDSSLPFPDTPDKLMANFQAIYENMDADEYLLILDPEFETHLQSFTTTAYPVVGATLNVTEETRIHGRLFSGLPLTDSGGGYLPPVFSFGFNKFRKVVDWGESLVTDPIPQTLSALYEVEILVDRGQNSSVLMVAGQIRFYVTPAEGMLNGQPRTYYRLRGQVDLTNSGKGVEEVSWGMLKAVYF